MELAELKNSKKNSNQLDNVTDLYSAPSPPSYSYYKLNENTDIITSLRPNRKTPNSEGPNFLEFI